MKQPKSIQPKRNKDKGKGVEPLLRFFVRHGEKIIAGIIVIAALWIALQGRGYHSLSWQANELEELVNRTEKTIKDGHYTLADEKINFFDYATYAKQIKEQIPSEPYRNEAAWNPVLHPEPPLRSGFEILTAEMLRGEAVRRTALPAKGISADQWKRPPLSKTAEESQQRTSQNESSIWVNLYGTLPLRKQWDIYNLVSDNVIEASRPEYAYYELERAKIAPNETPVWQPIIIYPADEFQTDQNLNDYSDYSTERLISFGGRQGTSQTQYVNNSENLLLFSDFEVEPARTYAYRIRLYLVNPNYNLQESSVKEGVDTTNQFLRSDWSTFARVYVPDRTSVQLQSVTPADNADFPRQAVPLRAARGILSLDYFDIELGQSLPSVEKKDVLRGMLCNMSKAEANKYLNRGETSGGTVSVNYPDTGLRSDVCIVDFSGGKRLQKKASRESQASPDLFVDSKALLLMPDGTMQATSTSPELFK